MLARLEGARLVVGSRQLQKAIGSGAVREVYLAQDADIFITRAITQLCEEKRIALREASSMAALGAACKIDVPAACAGILK